MSSAHLSSRDWTPEYYDFNKQYRAICREIRHKAFEDVLPFLRKVVREGLLKKIELHYWWDFHPCHSPVRKVKVRVNIHPKVIENIKNLLDAPEV
jgi:hypothetical protein